MKNKVLLIIGFIVSIIVSFVLGYFIATPKKVETPIDKPEQNKECDCNNYCQTYVENLKQNEESFVELTQEQQKVYDAVYKYGNEIYKNKKYEALQKDNSGVYYASIKDLENMGYDTSMFKSTCDKSTPVIYFDTEYKLDKNYANGPLQYSIDCSEVSQE